MPSLMHRIPSELRRLTCLGESSTRMGDLLGSSLVAPHLFCQFPGLSFFGLLLPYPSFPHLSFPARCPLPAKRRSTVIPREEQGTGQKSERPMDPGQGRQDVKIRRYA